MQPRETEIRARVAELVAELWALRESEREFIPGRSRVHYAGRVFNAEEMQNLAEASLDFWLTAGRFADEFETAFAAYFGAAEALLVNSGSSANLVALSALTSPQLGDRQLRPGDEVITAAAAFPSTVSPIVQNRLIPVFVDAELGTYNAAPDQIAEAIGPKTRAIMMAHTLGNPFDLDLVMDLARKHDLWVIEDDCDSLGSRFDGRLTGTFGDLATVSFYPAHHITMGEGGCVLAKEKSLARIAQSFRDWGRDCYCDAGKSNTCGRRFGQQFGTLPFGYDHKYVFSHIGYNLKLTDMQAAVGCAQLKKLPSFIAARKANFKTIIEGLKPYENRLLMPRALPKADPCWFGVPLTVREDAGFARNDLTNFLESRRIETRHLFSGNLLRHPAFMDIECRAIGDLPATDAIMERTFFIGCYPGLTPAHIAYVLEQFQEFFRTR